MEIKQLISSNQEETFNQNRVLLSTEPFYEPFKPEYVTILNNLYKANPLSALWDIPIGEFAEKLLCDGCGVLYARMDNGEIKSFILGVDFTLMNKKRVPYGIMFCPTILKKHLLKFESWISGVIGDCLTTYFVLSSFPFSGNESRNPEMEDSLLYFLKRSNPQYNLIFPSSEYFSPETLATYNKSKCYMSDESEVGLFDTLKMLDYCFTPNSISYILDDANKKEKGNEPTVYFYMEIRYETLLVCYCDNDNSYGKPVILPKEFAENHHVINPDDSIRKWMDKYTWSEIELDGYAAVKDKKTNETLPYFVSAPGVTTRAIIFHSVEFLDFYRIERTLNVYYVYEAMYMYTKDAISSQEYKNAMDGLLKKRYEEAPDDVKHEYDTNREPMDKNYQAILFFSGNMYDNFYDPFINEYTFQDDETTKFEMDMVSDIYTSVPMRYEDKESIISNIDRIENNFISNNLLTGLKFQDNFEFGDSEHQDRKFNHRIERFDLGSVRFLVSEELHYNYYSKAKIVPLSSHYIPLRLFVSCDSETHTASLLIVSLSHNDKASRILDCISRNEMMIHISETNKQYLRKSGIESRMRTMKVNGEDVEVIDLYDYLLAKFKLKRVGLPKNMIISPYLSTEEYPLQMKEGVDPDAYKKARQYTFSLLYNEAFFEQNEELGRMVTTEFDKTLAKSFGENIYDYSTTIVSQSSLLQCGETYMDYIAERIDFAVVGLFYFELITIEAAAIQIADESISNFMTAYYENAHINRGKKFALKLFSRRYNNVLQQIDDIRLEYAKTMDFWNVKLNYPSSQKSIKMLRDAFEIDKMVMRLERDRKEITSIYENKMNDQTKNMSFFVTIFAIISTLSTVYDMISDYAESGSSNFIDFILKGLIKLDLVTYLEIAILIFAVFFLAGKISMAIQAKKYNELIFHIEKKEDSRIDRK